jgi:Holliday junction resolvasome RuvABC endonuclease subunit
MAPADKTKMSVSERAKANRESARSGSGSTDKRSVNERIRSAMGMKNGGMTASKRADGIATKGKTRGKMC